MAAVTQQEVGNLSTGIRILFFMGMILTLLIAHRAIAMQKGKKEAFYLVLGAVVAIGIISYFKYMR